MAATKEAAEDYVQKHGVAVAPAECIAAAVRAGSAVPLDFIADQLKARRHGCGDKKPVVFFVLGGPGAGKGTQCAKTVEHFGYVHLSAGDLLRAERASGSEQGAMIDEYVKEGRIVPVEVTIKLLLAAIEKNGGSRSRFLIDGAKLTLAGVLMYEVAESVLEERLLERGKTSGRSDDNIESIKKRFATFKSESMPVVEYYRHQGLVSTFDGAKSVEEIWEETRAAIEGAEAKLSAAV